MAIPIIHDWKKYFTNPDEGLGSSYERIVINNVIRSLVERYGVETILETPSFGFTGMSGINLMNEALAGRKITLEDNDRERLDLIADLWTETGLSLNAVMNPDYRKLEYVDRAFDMAFNFSALWFVSDLKEFLSELTRVTDKVIMLSVPNRSGIGFKLQMKDYDPGKYPELHPQFIDTRSIEFIMGKLGWIKEQSGYFNCPPWPDIGMSKEDFLAKTIGLKRDLTEQNKPARADSAKKALTILDHYKGKEPDFPQRMQKFYFLERLAPVWFKRVWAHHYYTIFVPHA